MKRSMLFGTMGIVFLFTILLNACSSTKLVSSWTAPDVFIKKENKVLVIALMGIKDRKLRENVENAMVSQLKASGINAGSALAEYGPKVFEGLEETAALNKIRNSGYDGTFTIALLDKSKEKNYVPGSIGIMPYTYRFWGYYNTMWGRVYQPGYYSVTNRFMLEGNYYDLKADKLVYSAQTKSSDPASPQALAGDFTKTLFDDMMKKGIIKQ